MKAGRDLPGTAMRVSSAVAPAALEQTTRVYGEQTGGDAAWHAVALQSRQKQARNIAYAVAAVAGPHALDGKIVAEKNLVCVPVAYQACDGHRSLLR